MPGEKNGERIGTTYVIAVNDAAGKRRITLIITGLMKTLRLILGDQLNIEHSWFQDQSSDISYCMFEMRQEMDYVNHHIQKLIAFFKSMRSFADSLETLGHEIIYYRINDQRNTQSLIENISQIISDNGIERFEYILPDEFRLDEMLSSFCDSLDIQSQSFTSEHFLRERYHLVDAKKSGKKYIMERFYREIRKDYDILIDDGKPYGGKWNYDHQNRKALPRNAEVNEISLATTHVEEVYQDIIESGAEYIGTVDKDNFFWPTTRDQAKQVLSRFLNEALEQFGKYQDAMHTDYSFLYHSRISFALNVKLLNPLEVVKQTLAHWESNPHIDIASVEGFIRQIIGWREYMRCIYWAYMPDYESLNFFNHDRKLPSWYWTGDTKMSCMKHAISQSLSQSYAHHIQRLMITGNFALLAGIDPDDVDLWYLGIYIDAIQWVEITNTRGMSQYADGGIVATKPYISSASYINKMSNYCKGCHYNHKEKTGEKACPFNSLYWRFYAINRSKLSSNPRVSMMYRVWDKMSESQQSDYLEKAEYYLENIEKL